MNDNASGPMTGLSPYLHPKGGRANEAVEFYKDAFGATEVMRMPSDDGKLLMHVSLTINGGTVMMSDEFPAMGNTVREPGGFTIHLQVDDADTWWQRAVDAGATVKMPLADQFWGDRYGSLRDPFGFDWSIASPIKT